MDLIWNSKISVDSQQRNTKTKKKINNSEKMTNIAKKEKKREKDEKKTIKKNLYPMKISWDSVKQFHYPS